MEKQMDCTDRTKKYLIHNYWGQQEPSFSFKGNTVMTLFSCQLWWDLKGTKKCRNVGRILHFPDEHKDDQSSTLRRTTLMWEVTVQTATETSLPAQSKTVPCNIVLMNTFLVPGEEEQSSPGERQKDLELLLSFATNGRMLPVLVSATALPTPRQERYQ